MRSGGLTAADWAVITEYIEVLEPLKSATDRLQGRGKAGTHGALYEVIPVLESLISDLNTRLRTYTAVDFQPAEAPEDHIAINVRAALKKATTYFNRLLKSLSTTLPQRFIHVTSTTSNASGTISPNSYRPRVRVSSSFGVVTSQQQ